MTRKDIVLTVGGVLASLTLTYLLWKHETSAASVAASSPAVETSNGSGGVVYQDESASTISIPVSGGSGSGSTSYATTGTAGIQTDGSSTLDDLLNTFFNTNQASTATTGDVTSSSASTSGDPSTTTSSSTPVTATPVSTDTSSSTNTTTTSDPSSGAIISAPIQFNPIVSGTDGNFVVASPITSRMPVDSGNPRTVALQTLLN